MPNQSTNTNQHANSPTLRCIASMLLGAESTAQKSDLHARFDKALKGPRRFDVYEDFSGGEWDGAAGLIGTE